MINPLNYSPVIHPNILPIPHYFSVHLLLNLVKIMNSDLILMVIRVMNRDNLQSSIILPDRILRFLESYLRCGYLLLHMPLLNLLDLLSAIETAPYIHSLLVLHVDDLIPFGQIILVHLIGREVTREIALVDLLLEGARCPRAPLVIDHVPQILAGIPRI